MYEVLIRFNTVTVCVGMYYIYIYALTKINKFKPGFFYLFMLKKGKLLHNSKYYNCIELSKCMELFQFLR